MRQSLIAIAAAALSLGALSSADAQTSCNNSVPTSQSQATANTRQQAADLFQFLAPQVSQAVAGGSATLGQNSTVGGLGHFSLGVHGTVVAGSVPDVTNFPTCYSNAQNSAPLPTTKSAVPMVGADAAIGIFGGLPLALTNVGGLDLLLSAQYVPARTFSNVAIRTPDGSLQVGYGARIGLLSESLLVPGLSFSYIKRDMPKVTVAAARGNDSLGIGGMKLKSSSWRIAASKSLILLNVGAGVGQDKFDAGVDTVTAVVSTTGFVGARGGLGPQSQSLTRTNYFVNLSFSLLVAKLTAEVGQSTGGTITTFNSFSGAQPDGARTYGSLGVRFGL
jgi:hypothetical protein